METSSLWDCFLLRVSTLQNTAFFRQIPSLFQSAFPQAQPFWVLSFPFLAGSGFSLPLFPLEEGLAPRVPLEPRLSGSLMGQSQPLIFLCSSPSTLPIRQELCSIPSGELVFLKMMGLRLVLFLLILRNSCTILVVPIQPSGALAPCKDTRSLRYCSYQGFLVQQGPRSLTDLFQEQLQSTPRLAEMGGRAFVIFLVLATAYT